MVRRWPLVLALAGVGLLAAAAGLFWVEEPEREPVASVQVGGHAPGDLVRAASTPVVAIDPTDSDRVLVANRIESPRFSCSVYASADGGSTWHPSDVRLPRVGDRCYAPSVAFDGDGRGYLLLTMLEGRGNEPWGAFLFRSEDGGRTFGPPRRLLPRFSFQTSLVPSGDGSLYVSWLSGSEFSRHATFGLGPPPNPVLVAALRPGRERLSAPVTASAPPEAMVGGPVLAVGRGRAVHVLYWNFGDDVFDYYAFPGRYGGTHRLVLASSSDGGRTFRRRVVERAVVPAAPFLAYLPPLPALAVDGRTGALHAAWEDGRSGGREILYRRSTDGGRTWSRARVLFPGPAQSRTPALAVADGRLLALAYRFSASDRAEVAVRASEDGGRTFSAPVALTPAAFDVSFAPTLPNHPELVDLGSRLALAPSGERALAGWVDTRRGSPDTGKVDVFVARVPADLPDALGLRAAPAPPPARPSRTDRRLLGGCGGGARVDTRASALGVVRSFASALGRGELTRAYSYLDRRWRAGRPPVRAAHPLRDFRARYGTLSCLRLALAESYDRSEDGQWNTFRVWAAARRGAGPVRLLFGLVWTHSDTGRAPWSIIGLWTRELSRASSG